MSGTPENEAGCKGVEITLGEERALLVTPAMSNAGAQIIENQCDASPSLAVQVASMVFLAMLNEKGEHRAKAPKP